jgi:error-prone DNA polymerase
MDQLRQLCEGRQAELFSLEARPLVEQRLRQELNTIQANGQADVFVEAQRTVQRLRDQGGSYQLIGAGCCSLVSYLMQLSEIDPVLHELPYERFLSANTSQSIQFQIVAQPQTDTWRCCGSSRILGRPGSGPTP